MFAADIKLQRMNRIRGFRNWSWQLDEIFVKTNGQTRNLWRAVDCKVEVLEGYVTKKRDNRGGPHPISSLSQL